jgi:hypothetical protein
VSENKQMMSKKSKVKIWMQAKKPRPPKFFLSSREQKDGETMRIQQWLDLADVALQQTAEPDEDLLSFKRKA